jgi:hypothetical protein
MKKLITLAIALAMLATMIVPVAALAAPDSGTVVVTGPLSFTLEIADPSAITLGEIYGSTGDAAGTGGTGGTVTCTEPTGYNLTISSSDADGKLKKDGTGAQLANALKVTASLNTGAGAEVTQTSITDAAVKDDPVTPLGSTTTGSTGANTITLSVAQPKQITGTAGSYSITLTFTATAN